MLTRAYIEALLVDEGLADEVWAARQTSEIDDFLAFVGWSMIAATANPSSHI